MPTNSSKDNEDKVWMVEWEIQNKSRQIQLCFLCHLFNDLFGSKSFISIAITCIKQEQYLKEWFAWYSILWLNPKFDNYLFDDT